MKKFEKITSLILLCSLSSASLFAAPHRIAHAINTANNKRKIRVSPIATGERLIATGDYDTATFLLKAITLDNHFAWIKVTPSISILRGGKLIHADAVQEGDKLLCLGNWKGSSDDRSFYATQIKVIGQISYMSLHDKIAAACQSMASDGPRSAPSTVSPNSLPSTTPDADNSSPSDDSQKRQAIRSYCVAEGSRMKAVDSTRTRLFDLMYKIEANPDEISLYHDKYDAAINDYATALYRLRTISPVPDEMERANRLLIEACSKYQGIADLAQSNFGEIWAGDPLGRTEENMKQYKLAGDDLFDQSLAECQKALDKFFG